MEFIAPGENFVVVRISQEFNFAVAGIFLRGFIFADGIIHNSS